MTAFTAMKQALEYFEQGNFPYPTKIATDLRAAIAELEQTQPVAWIYQNANTNHEYLVWKSSPGGRNWRALYTAPPAPAIPAGWQPIETAPKDGTAILVSNGRGVWVAKYKAVFQSGYKPDSPWFCLMLNKDYIPGKFRAGAPTHWQPLPQPPKEAT